MKRTLTLAAALLAAATAAATPAVATTCPLLSDPTAEIDPVGGWAGLAYDPAYDIVSADLASDGTDLTVVLRLADLAATSLTDGEYRVHFTVNGQELSLDTYRSADGSSAVTANAWTVDALGFSAATILGTGTGWVDVAGDAVHATVPLSVLQNGVAFAAGDTVGGITARAYRGGLTVGALTDTGTTAQTYAVDSAGCIAVE
jgi:hypothetical protein